MRATDDLTLSTSSTNQGRLTINAQVAGRQPAERDARRDRHDPGAQVLHLNLTGTATDDIGVAAVEVAIQDRDTSRYLQANGTCRRRTPRLQPSWRIRTATSTTWTLSSDLPTQGDWAVTAYGYDTVGQQDTSTTRGDARVRDLPG